MARPEEKWRGSIEAEKLVDLVVWSQDLYSIALEDMGQLETLTTIVGDKIVYGKE